MKPKPFIHTNTNLYEYKFEFVNTNLSSCFTEITEVWVGFATMVILSLIFFSSPVWPVNKP